MKKLALLFVGLLVLGFAFAALGLFLAGGSTSLGKPVFLVWRVSGEIPERAQGSLFPFSRTSNAASVSILHRAFSAARHDPKVRGAAVYLDNAGFGLAKAQEFRRQLEALSAAGKATHCFLETAGEGSNGTLVYYLASACDHITLAPSGELNLLGLYANSTFFKGAFDKLRIQPDFLHVGAYKSATETYTQTERSPEAEEAVAALLDGNYTQLVEDIALARQLDQTAVRAAFDSAPHGAPQALELGLVDSVSYADAFREDLEENDQEASFVSVLDYSGPRTRGQKLLAILSVEGTIVRGEGGVEPWTDEVFIGSQDLARQLEQLRENERVVAVVLRIDSPGGSALASDLILHEVERLRAEKPVVVSMSDVAASGGYYIAARASKIVAEAATITGSIGVFAGKLATRQFQEELLGVTNDAAKRGARADLFSSLDPFTPDQAQVFEERMHATYDTFLGHVAQGRGMPREAVEKVAAGRVWTGTAALSAGLVDELGGLDLAINLAREAAGLDGSEVVRVVYLPHPPSILDTLWHGTEPPIPAQLKQLARVLSPRPMLSLELSPELRSLARPF